MIDYLQALVHAVQFAMSDLELVSADNPHEVLLKEEQFRSAMYHSLRNQGYVVHVEATYPGTREECDLCARRGAGDEVWIELKRTWGVNTSGWVNKPAEQYTTWERDVSKLRQAPKEGAKAFVLFGVFDGDPRDNPRGVMKRIASFHPDAIEYVTPPLPFNWRDTGVRVLMVWVWIWRGEEGDRNYSLLHGSSIPSQ